MLIYAFGHRKRVGKDTFASYCFEHLRRKHPRQNIQKTSFAFQLKLMTYQLYSHLGVREPNFYDLHPEKKDQKLVGTDKTVRDLYIALGNKLREFDPHVWINACFNITSADFLLITDLRYPNEFKAVKEQGGFCFKIVNPNVPNTDDVADCVLESETGWDEIINNDSDLNSLYNKAKGHVEKWEKLF